MKLTANARSLLRGERVHLRELSAADVTDRYHAWMHDPEVTRYLESRFTVFSKPELVDYVQARLADPDCLFLAIVLNEGNRHIGNIKLGPIHWVHKHGDIGLLIGEKDCWGKGFAVDAIALLRDFAFQELQLHKVTAGCYADNLGSARAFEKAGFVLQGRRKEHYFSDGKFVDHLLLECLAGETVAKVAKAAKVA